MKILLTRKAEKQLQSLPSDAIEKITESLHKLLSEPRSSDLKKLKGKQDLWRLRVGDYRVILQIDYGQKMIYALYIGHRKDIYRET